MRILAIYLFVAMQISVSSVFAQNETPQVDALVDQGDVLYKTKGGKLQALAKYRAAIDLNPEHSRANYMAGLCYLHTADKSRSLNYFLKAHDVEPDFVPEIKVGSDLFPDLRFLIGRAFQIGENYSKAQEYYNYFKESINQLSASRYSLVNKGAALRASDRRIFECMVAEEMKKFPRDSRIVNLKNINSPFPDYGPVLTPDGKSMYFTSRREGGASPLVDDDLYFFEDIYISKKDSAGEWGKAQMVKELCTPGHESVLCISDDGKTMILSGGENNGDLYISQKIADGRWGVAAPLGKNINTSSRETGAFLVPGGQKLYFVSDRSGGFGGLDLYVSERRSNGKWGSAINLGPKVNTTFDEDAPTIAKEGDALIFSSKGHKSMGGFDIFRAKWDAANGVFKNPENMGFPINSADDDNTYMASPDSGLAYYASFKENGAGDLDIYHLLKGAPIPDSVKKDREEFKEIAKVNVPLLETAVNDLAKDTSAVAADEADKVAQREVEAKAQEVAQTTTQTQPEATDDVRKFEVKVIENEPVAFASIANGEGYYMYNSAELLASSKGTGSYRKETSIRILIMDTETRIPLDGDVVFVDQDTKEKIIPTRVRNGVYELNITNTTPKDLMVSAEKEGFHFKNIMISIPPASISQSILLTRNIELRRHTLNKPRILRNVYFDFDQTQLSERSHHELDMLHKMLAENEKLIIEVSGHADFLGDDQYNADLSKKRAEMVVSYLVNKGIDKSRLRGEGYGENKPAPGTDETENGRALNRRTEFMILAH